MTIDIGWDLHRSLLAVLEEGSLSGAARALGITQPTVGRHIATLEESFGVALFSRSPTGLQPTEAAIALKPFAESMRNTAATLRRTASGHGGGVSGAVRVSCSEIIGIEVLPPIIAELRQQHASLEVELVLTNEVQDLLHREADVAVRMLRPEQESLIARHIGELEVGMYANRFYLDRFPAPRRTEDITHHTLIGFDRETPFLRSVIDAYEWLDRDTFAIRADNDLAQLAMVRAGAGIGFCQVAIARKDKTLVRVLPEAFSLRL
ncbi:MAG: LysR family transcriptional regulator, partial [Dokdonella sp.]